MSKFSELSKKIQAEGKSKQAADAIAASIGRKKYGKQGMAKKAAKGKKKHDAENAKEEKDAQEEKDKQKKKKRKYTTTEQSVMNAMMKG
jgi:hypothetical protein